MRKSAVYQTKRSHDPPWYSKWVQSPRWLFVCGLVGVACMAVYAVGVYLGSARPDTPWGLGYGIGAATALLATLLYPGRRRMLGVRALGRSWHYLELHVYVGLLFLLLVFMHVGFRIPQGVLAWWLWLLSIWVVGTGLLGLAVQKWIPALLTSGLSMEVQRERIPELGAEIRARAEELASVASEPVRELYRRDVAPALAGPQPKWIYFVDVSGGVRAKTRHFDHIRNALPEADRRRIDELRTLYSTKLELDAHLTLQRALQGWLVLHVPAAVILVALAALHILSVSYY